MRSFISSYGRTSSTTSTPAFSSGGLPSEKWSSRTQALNGSATTGHRSFTPKSRRTSAAISKVVAGVMRSTIELGNRTCSATHSASPGSRRSALASTARAATSPLFSMLSQDTIVGRVTVVDDRADHLCVPAAVGVFQDQRVEPVLIVQDVAHGPVGRHHPHTADAPLMCQAVLQQQVDVRGLVRPMEVAGSDVCDPDADAAAVIFRRIDRQAFQR